MATLIKLTGLVGVKVQKVSAVSSYAGMKMLDNPFNLDISNALAM